MNSVERVMSSRKFFLVFLVLMSLQCDLINSKGTRTKKGARNASSVQKIARRNRPTSEKVTASRSKSSEIRNLASLFRRQAEELRKQAEEIRWRNEQQMKKLKDQALQLEKQATQLGQSAESLAKEVSKKP